MQKCHNNNNNNNNKNNNNPSRAGPPPRGHQRRQPSDFIPAHLHHAAAVQSYHVRCSLTHLRKLLS